ncbi:hypothetical protein ACE939_02860 [Aquimarina sp. W85]|uniref:hypothetical protein n=1 Tax=Aquimarina rhodophyticola TaxID=3342246 RepID=UPI00366FBCBE
MFVSTILHSFQLFTIWFKTLLGELLNNFISVAFILAIYLALWHFPQTIDLLLILNQADAFIFEVPLYFILLLTSAFLIWNIPKYFYYHNYKDIKWNNLIGFIPNQHYRYQNHKGNTRYSYAVKIHMRKTVPRILATLLLCITAISILNAMERFGLRNTYTYFLNPNNTLLLCILGLLLLCEPRLYKFLQNLFYKLPKTNLIAFTISVGLLIIIISLGTLNTQTEKDLGNLFLSNCLLALFFLSLTLNSYRVLQRISKNIFYGTILSSGLLVLVAFIVLNFIPEWASKINPLSILVVSLLSLFMFSFILILLGKKIKLPLLSIVLIVSFLSSEYLTKDSDHYHLTLKTTAAKRVSMNEYMVKWIQSRKETIESKKVFPVLLISAEGGGSRAGLWSFLVHSYLYERTHGSYFKENLLSLSGASGGSVGNGMFFAAARNAQLNNEQTTFLQDKNSKFPQLNYKASVIYRENFLSEALVGLLGRDLFKSVTKLFNFRNRGQLLEDQWKRSHKTFFTTNDKEGLLAKEFMSFYKDLFSPTLTNELQIPPLLFVNTTHTQTGNYNIISPVTYDLLRPLKGMNDFFSNLHLSHPEASIDLSTALRINASFPFITPVGEIKNCNVPSQDWSDQFADAGYYDNIGGTVSIGVEEIFKKVLQDSFPELVRKIRIKHVILVNDEERKIAKTESQLAAPLTTLRNVRYGHTQEIVQKLGERYAVKLRETTVFPWKQEDTQNHDSDELKIKPVLPLGRYLSTIAIRSMEARLQQVAPQLDKIMELDNDN